MVSYCSIEVHQIIMSRLGVRSKYLNKTTKEKRNNYILLCFQDFSGHHFWQLIFYVCFDDKMKLRSEYWYTLPNKSFFFFKKWFIKKPLIGLIFSYPSVLTGPF